VSTTRVANVSTTLPSLRQLLTSALRQVVVTPIADIRVTPSGYRCPWVARPITRKRINLIHVSDRTTERPSELLAEGTFGREISKEKDIYVSMDASCIVVQDNPRIGISAPRRPLSRRAKICSISTLNICVTQRCSQNLMRG